MEGKSLHHCLPQVGLRPADSAELLMQGARGGPVKALETVVHRGMQEAGFISLVSGHGSLSLCQEPPPPPTCPTGFVLKPPSWSGQAEHVPSRGWWGPIPEWSTVDMTGCGLSRTPEVGPPHRTHSPAKCALERVPTGELQMRERHFLGWEYLRKGLSSSGGHGD